ncbi:unnamed protein product [Allacma fusca]|uniref:Uncharacterized protein n=1 Tax=Allacma fusca TaxID=39272 RepID=A0A8J2PAU8_9HEXA|nr:unnamed protein product [Allacma fusca]
MALHWFADYLLTLRDIFVSWWRGPDKHPELVCLTTGDSRVLALFNFQPLFDVEELSNSLKELMTDDEDEEWFDARDEIIGP